MIVTRKAHAADEGALLVLLEELQEHERQFESNHRPGPEMARDYLPYLKQQCLENDGTILVAEFDGAIVGLLCVWRRQQLDEHMSQPFEIAYVSDLIVSKSQRRHGVGTRLLDEAEAYARAHDLRMVKIGSLSRNFHAKELYRKRGFRDYSIQLVKDLRLRGR